MSKTSDSELGLPDSNTNPSTGANEHSILLVKQIDDPVPSNKDDRLYVFPVDANGEFTQLPKLAYASSSPGAVPAGGIQSNKNPQRLVFSLATRPSGGTSPDAGMAFGTLPIKQDANAAHYSCYLVNAPRLTPENIWTRSAWNGPADGQRRVLGKALDTDIIVATAEGSLVRIRKATGAIEPLDPGKHPDIWRLLRNGCVVGWVTIDNDEFPLVNLAGFSPAITGQSAQPGGVQGTWDFKWPKGSIIRVYVDLGAQKQRVKEVADRWFEKANPGQLRFDFDATLDNYDVYLSLQQLVGERPVPETQLGTYCQRVPLGTPTCKCGWVDGLKDENGDPYPDEATYFQGLAFEQILLHEFGHILGLPHLHQHPRFKTRLKATLTPDSVRNEIEKQVGFKPTADDVRKDVTEPWPGDERFSDWLPIGGKEDQPGFYAPGSIMMGHPLRGIFEGDPISTPTLKFMTQPGVIDIEWLEHMYK